MIAKLVVWDVDRPAALRRLRAALAEYQIVGVTTNLAFLSAVAAHPAYAAGDLDTRFLERHRAGLVSGAAPAPDTVLALGALDVLLARSEEAEAAARESSDPHSPWNRTDGWLLNADAHHVLAFEDGERRVGVVAHYRAGGHLLELPGGTLLARAERDPAGDLVADLDGARVRATVVRGRDALTILTPGHAHRLGLFDPGAAAADRDVDAGRLTAPMPGKIVAVMVEPGAAVKKGAPLMVLEAMKMEHTITSPRDGTVAELHYGVGAIVEEGAQLLALAVHEG